MKTKSSCTLIDHCILSPLLALAGAFAFTQSSALTARGTEISTDQESGPPPNLEFNYPQKPVEPRALKERSYTSKTLLYGRTVNRQQRGAAAQTKPLELLASDGAAFDTFGWRVAVDGDIALVGAPFADADGRPDEGAAYVFRREPTSGAWTEEAKLTVECDTAVVQTCGFGISVALAGETALVGAPDADPNDNVSQGAAYVFVRDRANGIWTERAKLVASDGTALDQLGIEVALVDGIALVGAPFATVDGGTARGAAYVFERDPGSGTWLQRAKLTNPDGDEFDEFGAAVALSGQTALVGEPFVAVGENEVQGTVHVFEPDANGNWTRQAHLVACDGALGDDFGVALSRDVALIGARGVDVGGNAEQGAAYVFTRDFTTGAWIEQAKLSIADGASKDFFASHVGLFGDSALIGAPSSDKGRGVAYVFRREQDNKTWSEVAKLDPPTPEVGAGFGTVAIADRLALIGAPRADVSGTPDAGAAYVFTLEPNPSPSPTPTPTGTPGSRPRPTPRPHPTPMPRP